MTVEEVRTHVKASAEALFDEGQVTELRVIMQNGYIHSGYYDNFEALAEAAAHWDRNTTTQGIYWTLNPVHPDCLHRAKNKMRERVSKRQSTTSDKEIIRRKLILVDIDGANRPTGVSSTDDEVGRAKECALRAAGFLFRERGWTAPLVGMSGNGYHLLYKIDLPNDDRTTTAVKKVLHVLAALFDDDAVKIDTSVFNASRISKVYGTMVRKGDDTGERPHRRAVLVKGVS